MKKIDAWLVLWFGIILAAIQVINIASSIGVTFPSDTFTGTDAFSVTMLLVIAAIWGWAMVWAIGVLKDPCRD